MADSKKPTSPSVLIYLYPYLVSCFLKLKVESENSAYLDWLKESLNDKWCYLEAFCASAGVGIRAESGVKSIHFNPIASTPVKIAKVRKRLNVCKSGFFFSAAIIVAFNSTQSLCSVKHKICPENSA